MKNKIILILAVIVGLAAAGGLYVFLENMQKTYQIKGDFVKVVVASQRIPAKTQITAQMIELKDIPSNYVNERAAVDTKEVVGKVLKSEIFPGEQVLRDKLAKDNDPSGGLAFIIPPGRRAVTIAVNEVSGVAGLVRPGDRVDVIATFDPGTGSITTFLIQNVDVLSTDQITQASPEGKTAVTAHTITLSVTPDQAQPLVLCSEKGLIRLALRSATDQDAVDLPGIRLNQLAR